MPSVPTVPKVSASAPEGRYGATAPKLASNPASEGGPKGDVLKAVLSSPRPSAVAPPPRTGNPAQNQTPGTSGTLGTSGTDGFKDRFLAELKSAKATFYNLVVASAFRIDATTSGINFVFLPNQKNAKGQCEEQKAWLQSIAEKIAGTSVAVSISMSDASPVASAPVAPVAPVAPARDVKAEAMANSTVQAILEIFPVEKTTIEER